MSKSYFRFLQVDLLYIDIYQRHRKFLLLVEVICIKSTITYHESSFLHFHLFWREPMLKKIRNLNRESF